MPCLAGPGQSWEGPGQTWQVLGRSMAVLPGWQGEQQPPQSGSYMLYMPGNLSCVSRARVCREVAKTPGEVGRSQQYVRTARALFPAGWPLQQRPQLTLTKPAQQARPAPDAFSIWPYVRTDEPLRAAELRFPRSLPWRLGSQTGNCEVAPVVLTSKQFSGNLMDLLASTKYDET